MLYLQLDNTARKNKNQYILAFLAYLVQADIFSEVQLDVNYIYMALFVIVINFTDLSEFPYG